MIDQEKFNFEERYQNFKEYYQHNPVAFVEDFNPGIKLHTYQKAILNAILLKEKTVSFFNARMNQKLWLSNMRLEIMKAMKMNFQVWSLKGIDVYENGVLVKTIKHKKEDNNIKIINDKYYTSKELARYVVNKTKEIVGEDNITEYIEPSAGGGVFLDFLDKPFKAYDIDPEDERILKQDFLGLNLEYKKGRCIIGNPPYGEKNVLTVQFYKKAIHMSDYISFILPISQLKNNYQMFEFDLIYSEDLGLKNYSDRELRCCFNIYKRHINGFNSKPNYKLKDIIIKENRRTGQQIKDVKEYDIGICSFGSGIIGRIPQYQGQYAKEFYFKIHNKKLKDKIIELIATTNWELEVCNGISGQTNLAQWQVYKYIKEQIPEIN